MNLFNKELNNTNKQSSIQGISPSDLIQGLYSILSSHFRHHLFLYIYMDNMNKMEWLQIFLV